MNSLPSSFPDVNDGSAFINSLGSSQPKIRIAIVVNFVTSYREGFYRRLLDKDELCVTIFCHEPPVHLNLTSIHQQFAEHVRIVSGNFLFGEKIVLSKLPFKELFSEFDWKH